LDQRGRMSRRIASAHGALWIVLGTLAAVAVWSAVAACLIPGVIRASYSGTSLKVFNDVIQGQATRPVEVYLAVWDRTASRC
jgi:hypothetical protein